MSTSSSSGMNSSLENPSTWATPSSAGKLPGSTIPPLPPIQPPKDCPCHKHCEHMSRKRNIVLLTDGTGDQFGMHNTNVVELFSHLIKDDEIQCTYYDSGIGTYAKESWTSWKYVKQVIENKVDMAIAWNLKKKIFAMYEWLSETYRDGDCIFLFGYSRGAYQARVIAGMIERVGLLYKGNKNQIPFAYELYTSATETIGRNDRIGDTKNGKRKKEDAENAVKLCTKFKQTLCRPNVKVHFIGAWDTVSSVGVARGLTLPETATGMEHICVFRHALALDERRVKFLPEYAGGGVGPSGRGDVKEVWFSGCHADIGGGNAVNMDLNTFGPALRWMIYEAEQHGLHVHKYRGKWSPVKQKESLGVVWWPLEVVPIRRLSYETRDSTEKNWHRGSPRVIKEGQLIHDSVQIDMGRREGYVPRPRPPKDICWKHLPPDLREHDPFASPSTILSNLKDQGLSGLDDFDLSALNHLTSPGVDVNSISQYAYASDILLSALEPLDLDQYGQTLTQLIEVLAAFTPRCRSERRHKSGVIHKRICRLRLPYKPAMSKVISIHGDTMIAELVGSHNRENVDAVAFSSGHLILSASQKSMVIWDTATQKTEFRPLISQGQTCVAFSTDGIYLATGGQDGVVRIWNVNDMGKEPQTFTEHSDTVLCVAFSLDGRKIAAGSADDVIIIWRTSADENHETPSIRLQGPSSARGVSSVAFSPNHRDLVSRSRDGSSCLWNIATGHMVPNSQVREVTSVALSIDQVVAGLMDGHIHRWGLQPGSDPRFNDESLTEHSDLHPIACVAFSPNRRLMVTSSFDKIRAWDVQSKSKGSLGEYKVGYEVYSLAFSPDSKAVVTGAGCGLVQIWDINLITPNY